MRLERSVLILLLSTITITQKSVGKVPLDSLVSSLYTYPASKPGGCRLLTGGKSFLCWNSRLFTSRAIACTWYNSTITTLHSVFFERSGSTSGNYRTTNKLGSRKDYFWSTKHILRNSEVKDSIGGTSITSVKTPDLGYSAFVAACGCCLLAGTLKFSAAISALLSEILSSTVNVLAVLTSMTYKSSSCETPGSGARSPPPSRPYP